MFENTSKSSQEGLKILEKLRRTSEPRGNTICNFALNHLKEVIHAEKAMSNSYSHTSLFLQC